MIRILAVIGGLAGAAALSQYPAFTHAYVQRLGGQVDALAAVVADFDRSALNAGMTREEALADMQGTTFLDMHQADLRRTFRRYAVLSENLILLQEADPVTRLIMPHRMGDPETIAATWDDFEPGLQLTAPGAVSAGVGYLGGWAIVAALLAALAAPFRRRRGIA